MRCAPALAAIIDELENSGPLTSRILAKALSQPIHIDDVASFIHFAADNYVRNLIVRRDRFEPGERHWPAHVDDSKQLWNAIRAVSGGGNLDL